MLPAPRPQGAVVGTWWIAVVLVSTAAVLVPTVAVVLVQRIDEVPVPWIDAVPGLWIALVPLVEAVRLSWPGSRCPASHHASAVMDAVYPLRPPEQVAVHPGYTAGRSVPPRGQLAMKSSTSCSTQRTARLPMRIGFGKRDSAIMA